MFILLNIEKQADDRQNLPENMQHKLSFKLSFIINGVPDSFTGMVFENSQGELLLQHFNTPKGNKRKLITLKNKLVKRGFEQIKQSLFAVAKQESVHLPQQIGTLKKHISGTPRIKG